MSFYNRKTWNQILSNGQTVKWSGYLQESLRGILKSELCMYVILKEMENKKDEIACWNKKDSTSGIWDTIHYCLNRRVFVLSFLLAVITSSLLPNKFVFQLLSCHWHRDKAMIRRQSKTIQLNPLSRRQPDFTSHSEHMLSYPENSTFKSIKTFDLK